MNHKYFVKYGTFVKHPILCQEEWYMAKKRSTYVPIIYKMRYKRLHKRSATQKNGIYPRPNNFFYSCCFLFLFFFLFPYKFFVSLIVAQEQHTKNLNTRARDRKIDVMTYDCQNTSKSELYNERSCISKFATCQLISRDWRHLHKSNPTGKIHHSLSSMPHGCR